MGYLILQVILLILVAFVIGVFIGCWGRKSFGSAAANTHSAPSEATALPPAKSSPPVSTIDSKPEKSVAKPSVLSAPRGGKADDLKRIKGIGKVNEGRLHELGIYHFDQLAGWSREEIDWVDEYLTFKGRIEREDWIGQAKILAKT